MNLQQIKLEHRLVYRHENWYRQTSFVKGVDTSLDNNRSISGRFIHNWKGHINVYWDRQLTNKN